jgi:arylsulfatase
LASFPQDCQLTTRHPDIPAWEEMPAELKPVLARQMELYAGFLEHTDHQVRRLLDALEDLEILDDTLVYVIVGDNGASAEGSLQGTFNEYVTLSGFGHLETPEFLNANLDKFGGVEAYNHTRSVGRMRWTRRISGPSRWPRTSAGRATARSCTGPRGSGPKVRSAASSIT